MKQISEINEPLKSKVKWKESIYRTASFNKKSSSGSLLKVEKIENSDSIKLQEKNNLNSKSKEIRGAKPNATMRQSKSPLFDKLYEQAKNLKSKIEDKRNQLMDNLKKKSVPKILKVSKKIDRNPNLFSERLYPYHKLAKVEGEEAEAQNEKEYEYLHVATVRSNPLGISGDYENEEFKNNIDNIFQDVEEIRTLYGNKPEYVKIYRGVKSKKIQKYPFKPDVQIKRGSNSLEHSLKKSEEKKISRSFHSNSPYKKNHEFYCESNNKNNSISKEIHICSSGFKSQKRRDKVNEFKENEENKNNVSSTSLPKKRNNSADGENLKNSGEKMNQKVIFAVEGDKNEIKKLSYDEVKKAILNTKSIDKKNVENKNKIEANIIIKPENNPLSEKKKKENALRISEKLYTKGVNLLKKKEKQANEKSLAEKNVLAKLTFMPNVSNKQIKYNKGIKNNEEAVNNSLIKNNSFTSGFSKSFDNMIAVKKQTNNFKNDKETKNEFSKSKSPLTKSNLDKSNKSNNRSSSPNSNIEIINNLNNKIKKSNQWQFPNKHAKKIFDSAYIALINNFNSEIVNKINKDSPNDCSTNSSNNNSTLNKKNNNIIINKSVNGKESQLNSSQITRDRPSVVSRISENYHTVIDKRPMTNTGIYDRCKNWKENNNKNKNKMREKFEQERNKQCNFSPFIRKNINKELDDRFIRSESKHLDSYIKRRRSSLEHLEKQKKFEKKIFGKSFEKYSKKATQPEEFNFNHSISRKSKDMRNSAINLHKPEKVKDCRREFKTGNFFNQPVVEFEEDWNNKVDVSLNKNCNNSLIDFYAKNRNKLNKPMKMPSNTLLDKNRKVVNENLKLNKLEKKFSSSLKNNEKNKNELKIESKIILEDKNEYPLIEDIGKFAWNQSNDNNIVNSSPADEYNDNIEKNIEEKLLNKDMNVNLNYQLKLK